MFKDITIGQYVAGDSVIHKADARLKIFLTLVIVVLVFAVSTPSAYLILIAFTVFVVLISKIPIGYFLKGLKPVMFIIVFTVLLNLFLTPGNALWSQNILGISVKITDAGLKMSIMMFLRLTLLVILTSIMTLTTTPMELTDGIEHLLKPLKIIKVPSHEIAMMMSIALRFIPTFAEETDKIIKAQKARGADFESGNIIMRAKSMIPLLVPLFVSAFRRADELATAMDARCYNGSKNRTRMKQMKFEKRDYYILLVFLLLTSAVFIFN